MESTSAISNTLETAPTTSVTAICNHAVTTTNITTNTNSDTTTTTVDVPRTLLGTIQLFIEDAWKNLVPIRGIVDPGSEINLITNSLVSRLSLPRRQASYSVRGVGKNDTKGKGLTNLTVASMYNSNERHQLSALILDTICQALPSERVKIELSPELQQLQLADPKFGHPDQIDILLGCEFYAAISESSIIKGKPTAFKTSFGWLLLGQIDDKTTTTNPTNITLLTKIESLDAVLTRFWNLEEINTTINHPEDDFLEEHFQSTHVREKDGRYTVRLPLKSDASPIGNNTKTAMSSFLRLERKLLRQTVPINEYEKFMQDYLKQKHMTITRDNSHYILPHHCVFKDSTSTHLRVVFDASARDEFGFSINDKQHTGISYLKDIAEIIQQFRFFNVAMTCDIRQMYRQIWVHVDDRCYQHIYYRSPVNGSIDEYELNTVTYGMTSSPFLAQRVLRQLAADEGSRFPRAAKAIYNNSYMDDFAIRANSEEDAVRLKQELILLLDAGGFDVRKWASNSPTVLAGLTADYKEIGRRLPLGEGSKVLGLLWEHKDDIFCFDISAFPTQTITKRTVASFIAKIYDVLGFLAPVTFKAKVFLQKLWLVKSTWDEPLPDNLQISWQTFTESFPSLSTLRIPRRVPVNEGNCRLLGFADASEHGMAAVLYLHIIDTCYLLRAKTKIAPLKRQTIPRLELIAALLLSELTHAVLPQLNELTLHNIHLFSDSQIVLSWLKTAPHLLKTFVGDRVSRILELTNIENWAHVRTQNNAADSPSRGLSPLQFLERSNEWIFGPEAFRKPVDEWPKKR